MRDHLQEQKYSDSCIPKAHPSTGDSSQRLGTWSILHSLQVRGCPFQEPQLVCPSSRQLLWSESLLCSLALLSEGDPGKKGHSESG